MIKFYKKILFPVVCTLIMLLSGTGLAATTGSGTDDLFTVFGPSLSTANGDYYASTGGLSTYYSFWIEVPPGATNMRVGFFDADIGSNHDRLADSGRVTYELRNPAGTIVRTANCNTSCSGLNNSNANNRWRHYSSDVSNPVTGMWELRISISNPSSNWNTFGLRVRGRQGPVRDYNVFYYAAASMSYGSGNPAVSARPLTNYPYVTSGCSLGSNDFDFDATSGGAGSTVSITAPGGTSTGITPLSVNDGWHAQTINVEGRDDSAEEYGLWTLQPTPRDTGFANMAFWYLNTEGSSTGAPSSRFQLNDYRAHRIYLGKGTTQSTPQGPPNKPYLAQWVRQNDPAGNPDEFTVTIRLINPTAFDITNAVVNGLVPSPVTYGGVRAGFPTHGSVTAQPGVGGSGALSWSPGTLPAGETAIRHGL